MNVLVIGGMHGNEPLGRAVVAALRRAPIPGVATMLANPRAIAANARFTEQDLNRSFPGDPGSPLYEPRRAAVIMRRAKGYDLVLDFHNTLCPDNDCAFVGPSPSELLIPVASFIGLTCVITAEYDCINKYLPNCLSVEISVDGPRMSVPEWIQTITGLAAASSLPPAGLVRRYRYLRTLTNADRDTHQLTAAGLTVFQPLSRRLSNLLGHSYPVYPIFLGQNYTQNVYAGLVEEMNEFAAITK
jgi:hypothetical protein